jgi:transcriptional antiterminator RfaH
MHGIAHDEARGCDLRWYIGETKRHAESTARAFLKARGISSYLPMARRWPRPAVGSEVGPLFPGYIFVRADLAWHYKTIERATGIKRMVSFGEDGPAEVPDYVIAFLREREDGDGLVRCIDEDSLDGRQVQLIRGPFRKLCGIVESHRNERDRIVLLIDLMNRKVRTDAPFDWVGPV